MDTTMTSTQFRKTYATLTEQVKVTANGHVIGYWTPTRPPLITFVNETHDWPEGMDAAVSTYNSRPFTPVPKKGK